MAATIAAAPSTTAACSVQRKVWNARSTRSRSPGACFPAKAIRTTRSRPSTRCLNRLVDREARIIRLFTPPFATSAKDPGYIKAYPPGVRENGGQYTHAATWVVMALAELNRGDDAMALLRAP